MDDKSGIEWTDATWNPGLPERLDQPLRWKKPRRVFVNSMSDLFHEDVRIDFQGAVFAVAAACPQHQFQILTKRPELAKEHFFRHIAEYPSSRNHPKSEHPHLVLNMYFKKYAGYRLEEMQEEWPLPNVHLGVSVESQATADERIPLLMECPAAVRWVSYEPALGPVAFHGWLRLSRIFPDDTPAYLKHRSGQKLDWIVAGGESGKNARPAQADWFRSVRDQCAASNVPFFFKQWGEFNEDGERVGKKRAGSFLDGREHKEYPT